jgi:hypothetical protein
MRSDRNRPITSSHCSKHAFSPETAKTNHQQSISDAFVSISVLNRVLRLLLVCAPSIAAPRIVDPSALPAARRLFPAPRSRPRRRARLRRGKCSRRSSSPMRVRLAVRMLATTNKRVWSGMRAPLLPRHLRHHHRRRHRHCRPRSRPNCWCAFSAKSGSLRTRTTRTTAASAGRTRTLTSERVSHWLFVSAPRSPARRYLSCSCMWQPFIKLVLWCATFPSNPQTDGSECDIFWFQV